MTKKAVYILGRDFSEIWREVTVVIFAGSVSFLSGLYTSLQNEEHLWSNLSSLTAIITCAISGLVFIFKLINLYFKADDYKMRASRLSMDDAMKERIEQAALNKVIEDKISEMCDEAALERKLKKTATTLEWDDKAKAYRVTKRKDGKTKEKK